MLLSYRFAKVFSLKNFPLYGICVDLKFIVPFCIVHFSITCDRLYPVCCTPLDVASILTIPWTANHRDILIAMRISKQLLKFYKFSTKYMQSRVLNLSFPFIIVPYSYQVNKKTLSFMVSFPVNLGAFIS